MYWWILGAVVAIMVVRFLWKAYTHPAHTLGRQAANMNWVAIGRVEDAAGYKNVRVARNDMEAVISFKNANVTLVKPKYPTSFKNFVELERWIATSEKHPTEDKEVAYYEAINKYITSMGFYETVLELQGTDEEFCIASMKMHKAGYLAGQSEKVVGALTMDAANHYRKSREIAVLFLQSAEERFLDKAG